MEQSAAIACDLSLFHLPVDQDPSQMEGSLSNRRTGKEQVKHSFWRSLSRRVDLTGEGSPMAAQAPYWARHQEDRTKLCQGPERFEGTLRNRYETSSSHNLATNRDMNRPYEVEAAFSQVTPQFFLRNVPRVLRDVEIEIRRPPLSYVEWTDHMPEYFEEIRAFSIEPPTLLEELSTQWLPALGRERWDAVNGFAWGDVTEQYHMRIPGYAPIRIAPPPRIHINDLSLAAAPPYRPTWKEAHFRTMKELEKLFDGSK